MSVVQLQEEQINECNVINFNRKGVKLKKDGTAKMTPCNSVKGDPHEVYPLKSKEDIESIKQYFKNKIDNADTPDHKRIAHRYLVAFVLGINLGLRASDLLSLTWGEILNSDGTFKDGIRKQEKKTSKYKTFYLNSSAQQIITEYIETWQPHIDKDAHIFKSRQGRGTLDVKTLCKVLKEAAEACGIQQNTGSHTLRKTFSYWFLMTHKGDVMALTHLQHLLNHSSQTATLRYAGLVDEQNKLYYNELNL
jgi:integrase